MKVEKINGVVIIPSAFAGMNRRQIEDMNLFHTDIDASNEALLKKLGIDQPVAEGAQADDKKSKVKDK